jgi:hypothetical protein
MLATALLALVVGGSAQAARPVIGANERGELTALLTQIGASDLLVLPAKLPAHFAFESFSVTGTPLGLDISFVDQRFLKTRELARRHEISYDTAYLKGACPRRSDTTLRVAGTKVYSVGGVVWRCVKSPRGRMVKVSAHGHLGRAQLAALVASVRSG